MIQNPYKILERFIQTAYKIVKIFVCDTKMIQNVYKILKQFIQTAYKIVKMFVCDVNDTKLIQNTRAIHTNSIQKAKISLIFVKFWAKSIILWKQKVELANMKILRKVELTFEKKSSNLVELTFGPKNMRLN